MRFARQILYSWIIFQTKYNSCRGPEQNCREEAAVTSPGRLSLWQIQLIVWKWIGKNKAWTLQTKHDMPALMYFLKCLF